MTTPPNARREKKSETLEVRLTLSEKQALAAHCRETGVSVSAYVRDRLRTGEAGRPDRRDWRAFLLWKGPDVMTPITAAPFAGALLLAGAMFAFASAPSTASDFRAAFDELDLDRDGAVTLAEFVEAAGAGGVPEGGRLRETGRMVSRAEMEGEIRQEFALYDRNRNGMITYAEFSGRYGTVIEAAFDHFDADGDGRVTAAELDAGMAFDMEGVRALVEQYDSDGDGALSFAEFSGD